MWKCQNLLRHHVKDLLDLIKKPKVTCTKTEYNKQLANNNGLPLTYFLYLFIVRSI